MTGYRKTTTSTPRLVTVRESVRGLQSTTHARRERIVVIVVERQEGVLVNRLEEPEDFGHFSIRLLGVDDDGARQAFERLGVLSSDHAYVDPAGLRALPGARPEDERWVVNVESMVAYARSKGWVDEFGRIRAHLVWE